jgi:hypothetical protein
MHPVHDAFMLLFFIAVNTFVFFPVSLCTQFLSSSYTSEISSPFAYHALMHFLYIFELVIVFVSLAVTIAAGAPQIRTVLS